MIILPVGIVSKKVIGPFSMIDRTRSCKVVDAAIVPCNRESMILRSGRSILLLARSCTAVVPHPTPAPTQIKNSGYKNITHKQLSNVSYSPLCEVFLSKIEQSQWIQRGRYTHQCNNLNLDLHSDRPLCSRLL